MRAAALGFAFFAAGCEGPLSTLDPAGPAARSVALLWWIMAAGAALIFAGVMLTALYALRSRRRGRRISERAMLVGGGLAFPAVVLTALLVYSLLLGDGIAGGDDAAPWRIDATSRQWDWRFDHRDAPATLRIQHEMHVPVGRVIALRVRSEDVIHSFWAPRLGGKIDAVPGKTNRLRLRADKTGRFLGACAEYCGVGHAGMGFVVVVHEDERALRAALAAQQARP